MKHLRMLCAPLALLLLLIQPLAAKTSFSPSIQPLQEAGGRTICTAWSINQQKGLWATAAHCVLAEDQMPGGPALVEVRFLHGQPAPAVFVNAETDLAVVQSPDRATTLLKGPAPIVGDKVSVFGFFWGGPTPTYLEGYIANLSLRGYMIFDMRAGPGHSGSPILNRKGEVVSVLQIGIGGLTGGATYEALTELLPYWGS